MNVMVVYEFGYEIIFVEFERSCIYKFMVEFGVFMSSVSVFCGFEVIIVVF